MSDSLEDVWPHQILRQNHHMIFDGVPEAGKLYQALTQHNQVLYQHLARYFCRCNSKLATKSDLGRLV